MSTRRDHPVLESIGIVVLFGALIAVAPGVLATFAVEHVLELRLDVGQRWTFAIACSALLAVTFAFRSQSAWRGLGRYMLLAVSLAAILFVSRFGFRAEWSAECLAAYKP